MSAESRVSVRYAKGLLAEGEAANNIESLKTNMEDFLETYEENRSLQLALSSPLLKSDKKFAILKALFDGKYETMTINFLKVACSKERAELLPSMAERFIEEYNVLQNIQVAELVTAVPVSKKTEAEFVRVVTEVTGKKADLKLQVNADIVGGFVLKIGDRQVDDSIKSKLNQLKLEFSDN